MKKLIIVSVLCIVFDGFLISILTLVISIKVNVCLLVNKNSDYNYFFNK